MALPIGIGANTSETLQHATQNVTAELRAHRLHVTRAPARNDPSGILLGATLAPDRAQASVTVNPASSQQPHRHLAVLGRHGADLTQSIMSPAVGLWLQGASLAILDPRGTLSPLARLCGGRVVQPLIGGQAISVWDLAGVADSFGFTRAVRNLQEFWRLTHDPLAEVFDQLTTVALDRHCTVFD